MKITKQDKLAAIRPFYNVHGIFSVDDIRRKHRGYWFSPDTMRFFKSRVLLDVFPSANGKIYFVSSEVTGFNTSERAFTVREYCPTKDAVDTIGEFGGYDTKAQALTAALNCAYKGLSA
jgi:hypothetical protein